MHRAPRIAAVMLLVFQAATLGDEVPEKSATPIKVTYPSIRDFRHGSKMLTLPQGEVTILRMGAKTDNNTILFMADVALKDFATKGKSPKVFESGNFRLLRVRDGWNDLNNPSTIVFHIDGRSLTLKCVREEKLLVADFNLEDLASIIAAEQISISISDLEFDLEPRHLEALRDLASRIPDGTSLKGKYLVEHIEDNPPAHDGKPGKVNPAVMLVVSEEKDKRLAAIKELVLKISAAKIKLKEAMIADDSKAIDEQKKSIEKMQSDLKWNVDAPLDRQTLNIFDLKDGKFGVISDPRVKIFQILEKENGSVLASVLEGPKKVTFRAVGLNPKNLVTDMYFPKEPFFVVDGTYSYETVGGESKTIYVLYAVSVPPIFTEAESIKLGSSATADFAKVELTSEEQSTLQQNREAAKLKVEQKELATKLRQAKSYLDSGKVLMKRDIKAGAKKQFEKAISTAPDSDTAKEAKKLLDSIP